MALAEGKQIDGQRHRQAWIIGIEVGNAQQAAETAWKPVELEPSVSKAA